MIRLASTLLFFTFLCTCVRAQSSEGTDFWFTFLQHRDPDNNMVALISAREATSGTLSIPGTGWNQAFSVGANQVLQVDLPRAAETLGSERVSPSAVHLVSSEPVSAYIHQYFRNRSEASLVLPTPVLGRDYLVMAYTGRPNNDINYPSAFAIVATEDQTEVTISNLRAATEAGRSVGDDIQVTLNQGQAYQVRASSASFDLTGTRITASSAVALYSGAAWSGVPANSCGVYDNLLEVTYPISQWGREYIGVPTLRNSGNLYRVLAAEDGTVVTVNGDNDFTLTLDAGNYQDFQQSGPVRIRSNQPVLVAEFLLGSQCNGHPIGGTGDPSFFLLNEVTQTQDTVTVYNSNLQLISENYLNILFRTGDEVGVLLDGAPVTAALESAPGGEYSFYRVPVSTGNHTVSSGGCGVIVTVYGYGDVESYSYGGGAAFRSINANPIAEGGCLNYSIQFATGLDTLRFRHTWTLEDGSIVRKESFRRLYDQLGEFPVRLIIEDECLGTQDTSFRNVSITLRQAVSVPDSARACAGEALSLEAVDLPGARYRWTGPNALEEATQRIEIGPLTIDDAGVYTVIGDIAGCETFPAEVSVAVDLPPAIAFSGDTTYCRRDEGRPMIDAGQFVSYQWSDGRSRNPLSISVPGVYALTVTDVNGCSSVDSVEVREFCPTRFYVPSAFSPNGDGVNDCFAVFAVDFEAVSLRVFDRWGGLVFESSADRPDWDGRVGEEPAATGTYLYQVSVEGVGEDGAARTQVQSGSLMLVR